MEATTNTTTTKTSAARIQVGDVIDFDQHKGVLPAYQDYEDMLRDRPAVVLTVANVDRVTISPFNSYRTQTAIAITFENGRTIHAMGGNKFPIVTA